MIGPTTRRLDLAAVGSPRVEKAVFSSRWYYPTTIRPHLTRLGVSIKFL